MNILLCIDDTDNIDSPGTGKLAAQLARRIEEGGLGDTGPVTRHQLLIHPDIPYTSHNSSMCFAAKVEEKFLARVTDCAADFLNSKSAAGSEPGLCIICPDTIPNSETLVSFGRQAKNKVISKDDAYALARRLNIHLSEHGGKGQGVIGALAGCGLRLTGNDGRFRGHFQVKADNNHIDVAGLKEQTGVDVVKCLDGTILQDDEIVFLGPKVKAVLQEGKPTLLVFSDYERTRNRRCWKTCTKEQLRVF